MRIEFKVINGDITRVPSDLLLLKHAGGFFGADEIVAARLLDAKKCSQDELNLKPNGHVIIDTRGAIVPSRVMFLGTVTLGEFAYAEMRDFARQAIEVIAGQDFSVRRLTTTIHGVGYGLDAEESLLSLVQGFEAALVACEGVAIQEISFVELSTRRAELLAAALRKRVPPVADPSSDGTQTKSNAVVSKFDQRDSIPESRAAADAIFATPKVAPKGHVFVAMPFSEEFEDVYEYGIYAPVRNCGFICEKTNESAFTGDILHRIRERIESAELVVADLTGARPNVYLEVCYAWGKGVEVIFVAKHGEELHFDVSRHRCIYYKSIRQLGRDLDKLIRGIFNMENLPSQ